MNWISRYLAVLEAREANRHQEVMDTLAFKKQKLEQAARKAFPPQAVVIPTDLEAVIAEESADWLREEMRQQYRKLYAEYNDWNMVRRAVGIGAID